jgi:transposase
MSKVVRETPKTWQEGRRLRAWELCQQGWSQRRIAHALGVSEGAVSQWLTRARREGVTALQSRPHPGPLPRLTQDQEAQVLEWLRQGAEACGFRGERWTLQRVREIIRRECGVTYSLAQVCRWLHRWKWTRQKPIRRARQRDEAAIREWREHRYPTLAKRGPA